MSSSGSSGSAIAVTHEIKTLKRNAGEEEIDFHFRAGQELVRLSESGGPREHYEYCYRICPSAKGGSAMEAIIFTLKSHAYCGTKSDMCKNGDQDSGVANHSHGVGRFTVNAVDAAIASQKGDPYYLGSKVNAQTRDEFSAADFAAPGILSFPGGMIYQNGSKEIWTELELRQFKGININLEQE